MTPGQTIGPFFGMALPYEGGEQVVAAGHPGAVELTGRVLDGAGEPVPDALVEIWQGEGFGRAATDADGRYRFTTVAPTPFAVLAVFARGLPHRLFTRVYPPGAAADALIGSLPQDRRHTLVAKASDRGLEFDVRFQGENETVFLSYE
jgi:protocatechuate 3,4-dioxygenase alpha subunit